MYCPIFYVSGGVLINNNYCVTILLCYDCYFSYRFERFVDTLTEEESEQITREKEEKEEVNAI